ncbi:hypothetical protein WN51_03689 [Melipona quadrifasciata]|uniref:Uncharacterized protein n=1 Tax=Melipona quadrifasciata TaxID=166423 RepID=A0A0N0BDL3_9HYME|nr:hypothetical protein WN51_03689 [Melipona quadrifasciata]
MTFDVLARLLLLRQQFRVSGKFARDATANVVARVVQPVLYFLRHNNGVHGNVSESLHAECSGFVYVQFIFHKEIIKKDCRDRAISVRQMGPRSFEKVVHLLKEVVVELAGPSGDYKGNESCEGVKDGCGRNFRFVALDQDYKSHFASFRSVSVEEQRCSDLIKLGFQSHRLNDGGCQEREDKLTVLKYMCQIRFVCHRLNVFNSARVICRWISGEWRSCDSNTIEECFQDACLKFLFFVFYMGKNLFANSIRCIFRLCFPGKRANDPRHIVKSSRVKHVRRLEHVPRMLSPDKGFRYICSALDENGSRSVQRKKKGKKRKDHSRWSDKRVADQQRKIYEWADVLKGMKDERTNGMDFRYSSDLIYSSKYIIIAARVLCHEYHALIVGSFSVLKFQNPVFLKDHSYVTDSQQLVKALVGNQIFHIVLLAVNFQVPLKFFDLDCESSQSPLFHRSPLHQIERTNSRLPSHESRRRIVDRKGTTTELIPGCFPGSINPPEAILVSPAGGIGIDNATRQVLVFYHDRKVGVAQEQDDRMVWPVEKWPTGKWIPPPDSKSDSSSRVRSNPTRCSCNESQTKFPKLKKITNERYESICLAYGTGRLLRKVQSVERDFSFLFLEDPRESLVPVSCFSFKQHARCPFLFTSILKTAIG